jgi:hypothetical protein
MSPRSNQQPEIKRMNINVETRLHDHFKAATAAQGKNMTDVLLEFIKEYVERHLPEQFRHGGRK